MANNLDKTVSSLEEQMAILQVMMSETDNKIEWEGYHTTFESIQAQHRLYSEVRNVDAAAKIAATITMDELLNQAATTSRSTVNEQALAALHYKPYDGPPNLQTTSYTYCDQPTVHNGSHNLENNYARKPPDVAFH